MLAPALRDRYDLSLTQIGVVLAAGGIGVLVTLLPWGLAADRIGERAVLVAGLGTCGLLLVATAYAPGFLSLVVLLGLAAAAGGGVSSASGRAVMHWFGSEERGLALGIRQTAIPLGGLVSAVVLPQLGLEAAFIFLGALCLGGAVVGLAVVREAGAGEEAERSLASVLGNRRLWRVCLASGLLVVAQSALIGFAVLFLHDERGFSTGEAAAVLAVVHVLAAALRIGAGRWSDVVGTRVVPLRRVGIAVFGAVSLAAALVSAPAAVLLPALVAAAALSMAWNGLSFAAVAELAGRTRSGAAIGVQQSVIAAVGSVAPVAFAVTLGATSWRAAFALAGLFPLAGWWLLREPG